jgi:hypothetical protein
MGTSRRWIGRYDRQNLSQNRAQSHETGVTDPWLRDADTRRAEYRWCTLIPDAEAMIANGPIQMLYLIWKDFTCNRLAVLWCHSVFGVENWHDFSHIAVVADPI